MADQMGISKSEVSRETIEAGTRVLQELAERDLGELDVLGVYLDGIVFGDYHVLAAVGADATGRKHVLGLREGPSENATVATGLLDELVERGLRGGAAAAVRHRRRQGTAQRHRPRVRWKVRRGHTHRQRLSSRRFLAYRHAVQCTELYRSG